jgi:hypothetical protein
MIIMAVLLAVNMNIVDGTFIGTGGRESADLTFILVDSGGDFTILGQHAGPMSIATMLYGMMLKASTTCILPCAKNIVSESLLSSDQYQTHLTAVT